MRRLWCALRGHKIDYFRPEPLGVTSLVYHCDCGRVFVSRKDFCLVMGEMIGDVA